jgi:hypothetical protein
MGRRFTFAGNLVKMILATGIGYQTVLLEGLASRNCETVQLQNARIASHQLNSFSWGIDSPPNGYRNKLTRLVTRYFLLTVLCSLATVRVCAQTPEASDHWSVLQLVEYHQHRRPQLQIQDVYKMLYQANFGVAHLLTDTSEVRKYLLDEFASMDTTIRGEQLIERISPTDEIVSVNLRPFKQLQLDPEKLVAAMFLSASETKPDTEEFYHDWNEFSGLVRYGLLEFPIKDLEEWNARVSSGNLESAHHSPQYMDNYKPAYRVVRRPVFESTFQEKDLEASTGEKK